MKLVAISLLLAVSVVAANAACSKLNETERAFALGNWLNGVFGKKNVTSRGFFNFWDGLFGGEEDVGEEEEESANSTTRGLFGWFDDPFGGDEENFFGDDDDLFDDDFFGSIDLPPVKPSQTKPQAPPQQDKPQQGNATVNSTRAWILGNWLSNVFGKNKTEATSRGLLGSWLNNVLGRNKTAATNRGLLTDWFDNVFGGNKDEAATASTTRGFGWWGSVFGDDDEFVIRPHRPHKGKGKGKPSQDKPNLGNSSRLNSTARAWLLDNLWNTVFPEDDVPAEIPATPAPGKIEASA